MKPSIRSRRPAAVVLAMAIALGAGGVTTATGSEALAAEHGKRASNPRRLQYSERRAPCVEYNPLRNPHFGDVHVHTSRSLDAGIQDTRTTPYQAYLFAKGERIGIQPWVPKDDRGKAGLAHMVPGSSATAAPASNATPLRTLQLGRPLQFAMVSDHAEFFGEVRICAERGLYEERRGAKEEGGLLNRGYISRRCRQLRDDPPAQFVSWNFDYLGTLPRLAIGDTLSRYSNVCGENGEKCLEAALDTWKEAKDAAEAAYDKTADCEFTAFVGYEYTSTPVSDNMHRNVLFRNANVPTLPVSYMEAKTPELLWGRLDAGCKKTEGCEVITIPHNSNVSGGRMFRRSPVRRRQRDFDAAYAKMRQQYEPLIEIYQHKGDSECQFGSPDELCKFEKMPFNNLIADRFGGFLTEPPGEDNFIRFALKRGLQLEEKLGVNPFKYGLVGSTDTHLGTPGAVNEVNFPGHGGAGADNNDLVPARADQEAAISRPRQDLPVGLTDGIAFSSGGLAVVWSEENSRDYLFDAMQRREAYATSGPRMIVRFFGGWDFPDDMCADVQYDPTAASLKRSKFVRTGYEAGVPMGSDLPGRAATNRGPVFAVAALKDPGFNTKDEASDLFERSTPLQQIQIIKGWVDKDGKAQERVVTVAGTSANGASVDLNTCEPRGEGADRLCAVWRDESFDPRQRAFYYARVVENPTCRWSWLQCNAYGQANEIVWKDACGKQGSLPEGFRNCCLHQSLSRGLGGAVKDGPLRGGLRKAMKERLLGTYPETVQERAWTSPIWYTASAR